ncbi:hypothetical protein IGI04_002128 [Brassica rapa subsp. trilocularis]|uniref:Secreted protein n=1 Tax=Brassica rapa subsp. trilocularis TaxID=1813537 RepID=A0ABQ7NWS3_BRACM|nr:hypothetical protein IGI04_002128 [Brassica rapa subsp. trilocularis]
MMLLTTISFFLSSLLPLLLPSHSFCLRMVLGYSFKSSSLFMCAEKTLVRLRSETEMWMRERRRSGRSSPSLSAGIYPPEIPHRYHMSRTKPPTSRSEQMRSLSTLACAPSVFFSTFN